MEQVRGGRVGSLPCIVRGDWCTGAMGYTARGVHDEQNIGVVLPPSSSLHI